MEKKINTPLFFHFAMCSVVGKKRKRVELDAPMDAPPDLPVKFAPFQSGADCSASFPLFVTPLDLEVVMMEYRLWWRLSKKSRTCVSRLKRGVGYLRHLNVPCGGTRVSVLCTLAKLTGMVTKYGEWCQRLHQDVPEFSLRTLLDFVSMCHRRLRSLEEYYCLHGNLENTSFLFQEGLPVFLDPDLVDPSIDDVSLFDLPELPVLPF